MFTSSFGSLSMLLPLMAHFAHGRALARLGEGEDVTAFFARYVDLADSGDRREAMEELKRVRDQIMPVLHFIHLYSRAGQGMFACHQERKSPLVSC